MTCPNEKCLSEMVRLGECSHRRAEEYECPKCKSRKVALKEDR